MAIHVSQDMSGVLSTRLENGSSIKSHGTIRYQIVTGEKER